MKLNRPSPSRSGEDWRRVVWTVVLTTLAPSLLFVVPFFVPVAPAFAESYLFGFNNRAALLLTIGLFAAVGVLSWRGVFAPSFLNQGPAEGLAAADGARGATRPSRLALGIALVAAAAMSVTYYLLLRSGQAVGDGVYFLDRVGLLAQGFRLYRDFEFVYGPLLLYVPLAIARVLHVSNADAYAAAWLGSTLLGLLALWLAVRWIDLPDRGKAVSFALFAAVLGSEALSYGLNYNPLRYAAPLAFLLGIERVARFPQAPTWRNDCRTILLSIVSAAFLLGLSPEIGLTCCLAVLCFLPGRRLASGQPFVAFALVLAAGLAGVCLGADRLGVFDTMKHFTAGSFQLPMLPAPHILLFFSGLAVVLLYLTAPRHRERLLSPVALLTLYSVGLLPAALGRCDWAHVTGYELGVFLCGMLVLAGNTMARRLSQTLMMGVFVLILARNLQGPVSLVVKVQLYPMLAHGEPTTALGRRVLARTRNSLTAIFGPVVGARKLARVYAVARMPSDDPHRLFPEASPTVYAPFGFSPKRLGNVQSPAIAEGRYMGALNILSPEQVAAKIAEMQAHPEQDLLLSPDGLLQCSAFRSERAVLQDLFLMPFVPRPLREYRLLDPICRYLQESYIVRTPASPETGDYALLRSKAR